MDNTDQSDICCITSNYNHLNSHENKQLVYCSQKGRLQIFDLRINKPALSYKCGVHRGLISCLEYSKDGRSLFLGTYGGYILNYDFRLNSLIDIYKYNENTPVYGLQTYIPTKGKEYDLYFHVC